jgi:Rho-binding antiterminator
MAVKYKPISCSYHDILESLSVMRELCNIVYVDEEHVQHSAKARIIDIFARGGEEFIRLDNGILIRLDRLRLVNETWFGPESC